MLQHISDPYYEYNLNLIDCSSKIYLWLSVKPNFSNEINKFYQTFSWRLLKLKRRSHKNDFVNNVIFIIMPIPFAIFQSTDSGIFFIQIWSKRYYKYLNRQQETEQFHSFSVIRYATWILYMKNILKHPVIL